MANLVGTGGNDTITSTVSGGVIGGGASALSDFILGQSGNDSIDGQGGLDSIFGGFGNDTIVVRTDATINGEDGSDTYRVSGTPGGGTIINDNGATGTDLLDQGNSTNISAITISGVETLGLRGSLLTLTRAQLDGFTTITSAGGATVGRIALLTGGSATTAVTGLTTLEVTGSTAADTLIFNSATTGLVVNAGNGADSIRGSSAADRLNGGANDDLLILRDGDIVFGDDGNDTILVAESPLSFTQVFGGAGSDIIRFQSDIDLSNVLLDVESIALNSFQVTLSGLNFAGLTLIADAGAPLGRVALLGSPVGPKLVENMTVLEVTMAGLGAPEVINELALSTTTGTRFHMIGIGNRDSLSGGGANDTIEGGSANDTIDGFGGIDILNGGTGNDWIRVRDGDIANGGDDDDRIQLVLSALPAGSVSMDGGNGSDALFVNGTQMLSAGDTVQNFETLMLNGADLTMTGAQFLDFRTIDANPEAVSVAASTLTLTSAVTMTPGQGVVVKNLPSLEINVSNQANWMDFSTSPTTGFAFTALTILGGTAGDYLAAGNANDYIAGDDGNDSLFGWNGNDTLNGGEGIDELWGENGDDELGVRDGDTGYGNDGNDLIRLNGSMSLASMLSGGDGTDTLYLGLIGITIGAAVDIFSDFEVLEIGSDSVTMAGTHLAAFESIKLFPGSTVGIALTTTASATLTVSGGTQLGIGGSAGGDRLDFAASGGGTALSLGGFGGNDSLIGGAANDTLRGLFDNDSLDGGGGDDSLEGFTGNDTLVGGAGADVMLGISGNDLLEAGDGDTAQAGDDNDVIHVNGAMTTGTLDGGNGTDTLDTAGTSSLGTAVVVTGIERIALDASAFTLFAAQLAGVTTLVASAGGSQGALALANATAVTQTVDASLTALSITGSGLSDVFALTAGAGTALTLLAGGGNDVLSGGAGLDLLSGEGGNDRITVGNGDTALGGNDDDLFLVSGTYSQATTIAGGAGVDTIQLSSLDANLAPGVTMTGVEVLLLPGLNNVTMTGTQFDGLDSVIGGAEPTNAAILLTSTANGAAVVSGLSSLVVSADAGDDRLDFGASGAGSALTLNGGIGADSLTGGAASDSLSGGTQNDVLTGGAGADVLDGGSGNDQVLGGAGNDLIFAGDGDIVQAGDDDDRVLVVGSMATGTLDGGLGSDRLGGGPGAALGAAVVVTGFETLAVSLDGFSLTGTQLAGIGTVRGLNDAPLGALTITSAVTATFAVDAGLTQLGVTASADADSLTFTNGTGTSISLNSLGGNDTLTTGAGADDVSAGDGKDSVSTGDGHDYIAGEAGADRINGGGGSDTILGGAGADKLRGAGGADVFRYEASTEGKDRISDFVAGTDLIQVSAAGFGGGLADDVELTAGQLVVKAGNAATAPSGTGQFVFNTTNSTLLWDADGAGGADGVAIATLSGVLSLATTDIVVIA